MSIWVSWFITGIFYNVSYCYILNKMLNCGKNIISYKPIFFSAFFSFFEAFVILTGNQSLRVIFILFIMFILFKIVFHLKNSKIIVCTFLIYLLFAISEVLYAFVCFFLLKIDTNMLQNNLGGIIFTNIVIAFIVFAFLKIKDIDKLMKNIIKWYTGKSIFILIMLILYSILSLFVLMSFVSNNTISNVPFIICIVFIFSIILFIVLMLRENADKNKIYNDYDNLLKYVDNYGKLIDEKSKETHEYKNQLIILKELIVDRNKKAKDYIDNILNNQFSNNKYIQTKSISNIPLNGIRGLLYYKINEMIEKNIEVYLDIRIKTKFGAVWKLCDQKLPEISKVMGVYLDNAIQASSKAYKKYIIIEILEEKNKLIFNLSNTYYGNIDLTKMDKEKYSTKGKGHGYGLSIVKDIIDKNEFLSQEREINGIYYVQKLMIDIKNKS